MTWLDAKIQSVEQAIVLLKDDRKALGKKIIENRQALATARNVLRELKKKKEAEHEKQPGISAAEGSRRME